MEEQEELIQPESPNGNHAEQDAAPTANQPSSHPIELNSFTQFGMLLAFIGCGIIAATVATLLIAKLMAPGLSILNLESLMSNPAYAGASKVIQLVSTVIMFFLPAYLFAHFAFGNPLQHLGFKNVSVSWQQLLLVSGIAFMAIFVGGGLAELNERIPISKSLYDSFKKAEDAYNDQILSMAKMNNALDYLIALFIIALMPAIVEETFFRGTLQQFFIKIVGNAWVGIIITSIIFSAIHMSYFGFLTRTSLGIVLGLLFYYSKNIWLSILAHFLNNAIAVTSLYIFSIQGKPMKEALKDDHFPLWVGLSAGALLVWFLVSFKQKSESILAQNFSAKAIIK